MIKAPVGLIPVLTSAAGSAMTAQNWEAIGVETAAYMLSALLMKPGFDVLLQCGSLRSYSGWGGHIVLNASDLSVDKSGMVVIRSIYDGRISRYTQESLITLINQLQPDVVVLPSFLSSGLSSSIFPFISSDVLGQWDRQHGVWFILKDNQVPDLHDFNQLPVYVMGNDMRKMQPALRDFWLESNEPASDALNGVIYDHAASFSIDSEEHSMAFSPLSGGCECPKCSQGLTRAYLHHLYAQTPLLCYRFLVQHNYYATCPAAHPEDQAH